MIASARLEHVSRAMQRALLGETEKLESGLNVLVMIYRLAPSLGILGAVLGLIELMNSHYQPTSIVIAEPYYIRALVPLGIGIFTWLMAYGMHTWLSSLVASWKVSADHASTVLLSALADMDGEQPPVAGHVVRRHLPRLKLTPNRGQLLRLGIFHTFTILIIGFMMLAFAKPSSWHPPHLSTPGLLAGESYEDVQRPSIWLALDGSVYLSDDGQDIEFLGAFDAEKLHALLQTHPNDEWLLYADRRVRYGRVQDVMDLMRAAGAARIHFMSDRAVSFF